MINIIRYILGFVKIKISSENPEMMLNKLISKGINIWCVERYNDYIVLCLLLKDYLKIRKLRREVKTTKRIKIIEKHGLKIDVKQIKPRKSIVIGFIIVLAINIFLSNFIWIVDVNGANQINTTDIIRECENIGVKIGCYRNKINTYDAAQSLALAYDKIAWVSLNVEGSKVTVNITESDESEKYKDKSSNIIASTDGVIKSIQDIKGSRSISIGQTVKKGDILISGIETVGNNVRYVYSKGEILAETRHQLKKKVSKQMSISTFVGKTENRAIVDFFSIKIPLYLSGVSKTDKSFSTNNKFSLFGVKMPVGITKRTFYLYENQEVVLSKDDAINFAVSEFTKDIINSKIHEIYDYELNVKEYDNEFEITLNIRCLEDIGVIEDISIPND